MVERLWRSVKYEEVYLKAYSSVTDAKKQLSAYFEFYNLKRPHSSLDMRYRLGSQSGFEIKCERSLFFAFGSLLYL